MDLEFDVIGIQNCYNPISSRFWEQSHFLTVPFETVHMSCIRLPYTGGMDLLLYVPDPMCTDIWGMAVLSCKSSSSYYLLQSDI